ncbi:MAG: amidohydrolase family protein [Azospirillaceae bacterium]
MATPETGSDASPAYGSAALRIRDARRWTDGASIDIDLEDGRIVAVHAAGTGGTFPGAELDAAGALAAPPFAEPHYHLDKAFAEAEPLPGGTLAEQLAAIGRAAADTPEATFTERAVRAAGLMVASGVTTIRTFADIDPHVGLRVFRALQEAKRRLSGLVDLQVIAFPQHGLFTEPGIAGNVERAVAEGADGVGGHPQLERDATDGHRQIERVCTLAREAGVPVDFHVDETDDPASAWLAPVVEGALAAGLAGRMSLAHCNSLAWKPHAERASLIALLAQAGATVVVSPTSGLLFRGHGADDPTRGIAPVRALLDGGVRVACGQEIYRSLFSRNLRYPDPLMSGQLLAYMTRMADDAGLERVFAMLTADAPASLGLAPRHLVPGEPADLVLLDGACVQDVLTRPPPARTVIKAGRVIARSRFAAEIAEPGTALAV